MGNPRSGPTAELGVRFPIDARQLQTFVGRQGLPPAVCSLPWSGAGQRCGAGWGVRVDGGTMPAVAQTRTKTFGVAAAPASVPLAGGCQYWGLPKCLDWTEMVAQSPTRPPVEFLHPVWTPTPYPRAQSPHSTIYAACRWARFLSMRRMWIDLAHLQGLKCLLAGYTEVPSLDPCCLSWYT